MAIDDDDLCAALAIDVTRVLRVVPVPRRTLERWFRAYLKRGPHEEIRRVRVNLAKDLLIRTDLPMPAVASRCGFCGHGRFIKVFREDVGVTPTAFRNQFRIRGD